MESWKSIAGFVGLYEVSNLGRVRSIERIVYRKGKGGTDSWKTIRERILKASPDSHGYPLVQLQGTMLSRRAKVHHLVAEAFIGPRPSGYDVRHLDGNRANNCVSNLAYGTRRENMDDARQHGTLAGENNGYSVLTREHVEEIRALVASGEKQRVVAERFSINQSNVSQIVSRKTWK